MTNRRLPTTDRDTANSDTAAPASLRHRHAPSSGMADRIARPHSREEAEAAYVAAREQWAAAMRAANSGRPSDMASLALAQEEYTGALAERQRWASSPTVAIPVEPDRPKAIDAVVGQELSWRRMHEHESQMERKEPRGLRRILRRITRR